MLSKDVRQCFSTGVPWDLRVPRAAARGFAETDRNYLGQNLQQQFYAFVAIPLFHRSITESRMDTWVPHKRRHTIYLYLDFGLKNSSFRLPYQRPSSSADCARELFKGSNRSTSLVDCTQKKFWGRGCGFCVTDVISEVVLGSFWLILLGLGPNREAKVFHWKLGLIPSLLSLWSTF